MPWSKNSRNEQERWKWKTPLVKQNILETSSPGELDMNPDQIDDIPSEPDAEDYQTGELEWSKEAVPDDDAN